MDKGGEGRKDRIVVQKYLEEEKREKGERN
jgi:hypothetical protein